MQILVQIDRTYMLDVEINDTIKSIKYKIQDKTGICCQEQRILFNGKQLDDNMRLTDYNIINLSVINVVLSLTNISKKLTPKITLNIDLSKISPFGKSTDSTELDMECDDTITMNSIFDYLNLNDLSNYLQIIFYHKIDAEIENEICFKYQQINNKTIFDIENIIHTQYVGIPNNYQHELYMKLCLNQKISSFSKPAITSKLNEFFNGKDEFNRSEIDIIALLLSLMGTLKSNDSMNILLHEIADCLCIFTQYGVPGEIIEDANQLMIPSIFKLLSYTNCNDEHMDQVIKVLIKCLFNIISKEPERYRNIILNELEENFCDPSQNKDCLYNIITFYHELIKNSPSESVEKRVLEQIYILLFYEDDGNVIMNALTVYHKYVNWWPDMLEDNMNDECIWSMKKKYGRKQAQNKLMFTGFIHKSLKQSNIQYIPNDLFILIFNYYDCYQNIQTNMMWRVMELLHKDKNGYSQDIASKALKITTEIISPLNALHNVLFDKNMLKNMFYENGLIGGLFVLMDDMESCFHAMNNIDDENHECWHCGKEKMCIKDINTDNFYCIDCCRQMILVKILDVIQDLLEENNIKDLCLDQIECLNKMDFWKKMKEKTQKFVLPHIAPQFLGDDDEDIVFSPDSPDDYDDTDDNDDDFD